MRRCAECPATTVKLCRYIFRGDLHAAKSHGGVGCEYPIDGVVDAWRTQIKSERARRAAGATASASQGVMI